MMKLLLQFRKMCDVHFHMQLDETERNPNDVKLLAPAPINPLFKKKVVQVASLYCCLTKVHFTISISESIVCENFC